MDLLNQTSTLFLVGLVVGVGSASLGAILDRRRARKRDGEPMRGLPPLLLVFVGILALVGAVVGALSLFLAGSLRPAWIVGLGVGVGFFLGFLISFLGAILVGGD